MSSTKHVKLYLVLGFLFSILFSHLPVVYTLFYHELTDAPIGDNGALDIQSASPVRTIVLDGEWEFFWKRLIVTDAQEDQPSDFIIHVPGYWSRYRVDGEYLPAAGYGSYRLALKGLDYPQPVTIFIPDFGSAYRVFIDGKLTAESGNVSKNLKEVFTVSRPKLYPVSLSPGGEHEVVIEVATTRFSGLYMAPVLKDYNKVMQEDSLRTGVRFILFGTVLFSFFILIVIYTLSYRKKMRSVWLPAIGIFLILRIMLTSEFYSFWQELLFFNLSYEATNELMFFVTFALKFLLIFLAQEQFGVFFSRKEKYVFLIYYIVVYLIYLLVPYDIYNRYLTIILPVATFALEIYAFFKLYFAKHHMKEYGIIVYWGIILAISGLIMDCYYINGNIYPNMSLTLLITLSIYMMILCIASALRIAGVYKDLAVSSSRLEQAKSQIAIQTEYYNALSGQINEIRGIKHDMHHFIGVIKRLSEEERYDELKQFLGEYAEKTETEPLPVFCENVVANSILGYYSLKAKERSIPFHCACSIPKKLSMSDSDLCIVLGNALENAIEACSDLSNSYERFISAEVRIINSHLLIRIDNSYSGQLNFQDGEYVSTKNEKTRGIGVRNIRKVVEAYGGYLKIEHTPRVFTLMVALPYSPL